MRTSLHPAFSILLVDDEPPWLRSLGMTLEGPGGYTNLIACSDSREACRILAAENVGLVLLDLTMPHVSGEELLAKIAEEHPDVTVIITSGMNQVETAVRCIRQGAYDYLVKTAGEELILDTIRRGVQVQELQRENRRMGSVLLSDELLQPEAFAGIVTGNCAMRSIFRYVEAVAKTTQPILVSGESGTGKELIAKAIHLGSRPQGPLVCVNVAGLDDQVFADTLFGHVRGAYTGALEARKGMIEKAADGTLFLDEIGDLSAASQVKLLRLLQEGEYYPLGSDAAKQSRARIVVATHHDLAAREEAKQFRRDLYFRLRAHHLHLPPLRERRDDLPLLLEHFLKEAAEALGKKTPAYPRELITLLNSYHFPGNVRELRSMVYDAVSLHSCRLLSMDAFVRAMGLKEGPAPVRRPAENCFAPFETLPTLEGAVDELVEEAMRRSGGNQSMASRILGISQPALSRRLKLLREGAASGESV